MRLPAGLMSRVSLPESDKYLRQKNSGREHLLIAGNNCWRFITDKRYITQASIQQMVLTSKKGLELMSKLRSLTE